MHPFRLISCMFEVCKNAAWEAQWHDNSQQSEIVWGLSNRQYQARSAATSRSACSRWPHAPDLYLLCNSPKFAKSFKHIAKPTRLHNLENLMKMSIVCRLCLRPHCTAVLFCTLCKFQQGHTQHCKGRWVNVPSDDLPNWIPHYFHFCEPRTSDWRVNLRAMKQKSLSETLYYLVSAGRVHIWHGDAASIRAAGIGCSVLTATVCLVSLFLAIHKFR